MTILWKVEFKTSNWTQYSVRIPFIRM